MFVSNPSRLSGWSYTPLSSSVFLQRVFPSNLTVFLLSYLHLFPSLFVGFSFFRSVFVSLSHSYFPPSSFQGRPLGNAIVAATLDTTESLTIPISTLRDRNSHPGFHPTNTYPSLVPSAFALSLPAFSIPCYYQLPPPPSPPPPPPSPSRNGGTTSGRCTEGRLGGRVSFLLGSRLTGDS